MPRTRRKSQAAITATIRTGFWQRLDTWAPLILALLAYGVAAALLFRNLHHFEGDEPHYVLMAHSLCQDHDADLRNNYEGQDYLPFYPRTELDPHGFDYRSNGALRSVHSIGLPILLTLPHCMLGHPYWARLEMAALAALASWIVFLTIRGWTERTGLAYATWAAIAFTAPVWTLAPQVYPDVVAFLGVAIALWLFSRRPLSPARILGIGIVAALLPWLHNRYAVLSLLIVTTTLARLFRARTGWKAYLPLLVPAAISSLLWMWNSYAWYGSVLPDSNYVHWSQNVQHFSLSRWYIALADLLLGREYGLLTFAPIYWLALVGGVMMILHRRRIFLAPLIWLMGYVLVVSLSQGIFQVDAGWSFPGRLLLPITPLLAIPLAYSLQQARWLRVVGAVLFIVSVAIAVQSLVQPYKALADRNGVSELPLLGRIQGIYPALQHIRESSEIDASSSYHETGQLTYHRMTETHVILADPDVDELGFVARGRVMAFWTGQYSATFTLGAAYADPSTIVARLDLVTDGGRRVLAQRDVYAHEFSDDLIPRAFALSFFTRNSWPLETRVYFTGQSRLWLHSISIKPREDSAPPVYSDVPIIAMWGLSVLIVGLAAVRKRKPPGMELASDEKDTP